MRIVTGIATMDKLFDKVEPKEQLQKLVEAAMARLRLGDWMGQRESLESAALIGPEQAAKQVYAQLESLMGRSKVPVGEVKATTQPLRLGYIHFGRRKAQRPLAPHYVAAIEIDGEEAQAYPFIVPATQRTDVPLCYAGQQPPAPVLRRAA